MISRKDFLKKTFLISAGSPLLLRSFTSEQSIAAPPLITILHTNDTHARIDPFPDNAIRHAGLGGIARRATLVNKIRSVQPNTLLLDAGDVFQGTTWFNVYGGSVDFELMSNMKYDAGVIGNHEFDNGPDGFAEAAKKASFPFLNANYAVRKTPFDSYVQKFMVKELAGFRIGIFGLGIRLDGVVDEKLTGDVQYRDPEIWANGMVSSLRKTHRCDYIICLSHLGYHYDDSRIDDKKLAARVKGIDLIIGGHTHTFLDHPVLVQTPEGGQTAITQAGHSGIRLGRIDLSVKNEKLFISDSIQYTINGN